MEITVGGKSKPSLSDFNGLDGTPCLPNLPHLYSLQSYQVPLLGELPELVS